MFERIFVLAGCLLIGLIAPSAAWADTGTAEADQASALDPVAGDMANLADAGMPSSAPTTTSAQDGAVVSVSAVDEYLKPVAPVTTALSSREYVVGGTFNGAITGAGPQQKGTLDVGYYIGCAIEMTGGPGVTMAGSAGLSILNPLSGSIAVSLKPGLINIVPVNKKSFVGASPSVKLSEYHVKIDGCIGQSFIRSYATLTRSTDAADTVVSYVGVSKAV